MAKRNMNGMGTVTRRKDGRWQAAVYVPQPDGTEKRKFVYGATREEAEIERGKLVDRARKKKPTPTRSPMLSEFLPYWLEQVIKPVRKKTTYAKYRTHVGRYLVPDLGSTRLQGLTVAKLRVYLNQHAARTTPATAVETHKVLRSALTAACAEELIDRNVASLVDPPRSVPKEFEPWTVEETRRFLEVIRRDPSYAAITLAVGLGMRRGEIAGLKWSQVDFDGRALRLGRQLQRVAGELYEDTTKGRKRPMPLPEICLIALRWQRWRWLALAASAGDRWPDTPYVFVTRTGRPVEPSNHYRSFVRLAQAAGMRSIRMHDARHGFATMMADSGKVEDRVLMELMGHSKISMTMDVYAHVVDKSKREAIKVVDELLKRKKPH